MFNRAPKQRDWKMQNSNGGMGAKLGRPEVARNIVVRGNGGWNIESLVPHQNIVSGAELES